MFLTILRGMRQMQKHQTVLVTIRLHIFRLGYQLHPLCLSTLHFQIFDKKESQSSQTENKNSGISQNKIQDFQAFSRISKNLPVFFRMFQDFLGFIRIFYNFQRFSTISYNFLEFSGIFWDFPFKIKFALIMSDFGYSICA